jgi:hypothetical protein
VDTLEFGDEGLGLGGSFWLECGNHLTESDKRRASKYLSQLLYFIRL